MKHTHSAGLGFAAALAAGAVVAPTANAATASHWAAQGRSAALVKGAVAGYVVAATGSTASFSTTVTVPTIDCSQSPADTVYVALGLEGSASGSTTASGAQLVLGCSGTTAETFTELFQNDVEVGSIAASPGDTVTVTGTVSPSSQSSSVDDTTSGVSLGETAGGFAPSEVFLDATAGTGTYPGFSSIPVSGTTFDGSTLTASESTQHEEISKGSVILRPTALSGGSFSIQSVHNP